MITPIPPTPVPAPTSGRPNYAPGELVDYTAQSGDTLHALAKRFNTTEEQIRTANPIIPADATTMPPGMPMKIPIYYLPLWGTPFQSIPERISFRILELYRIGRDKVGIIFDEGPGVCDAIDSPPSRDLEMIVALGANLKISLDDLPIDDLITRVAFYPKLIRGLWFFSYLFLFLFFFTFFKPGHPLRSSSLFR